MAVTRNPKGAKLAAAGDAINETLFIRWLYIHNDAAAGDFVFKDTAGKVMLTLTELANAQTKIEWPFGECATQGIELDAVPTSGTVELIFA